MMHVYGEITGTLSPGATISGTLSTPVRIAAELTVPEYVYPPVYSGPVEITPTNETQRLETDSFYMQSDIIINPIPSNYGLITWDGSTLLVS